MSAPETFQLDTRDVLYRYDVVRWSLGVDEFDNPIPGHHLDVRCAIYAITKRTKCGVWIDMYGTRKFVNLTARKQWACETRAAAAESFRRRKRRQIKILESQLADAKRALGLIDSAEVLV